MQIVYNKDDLLRIFREYHSWSKSPIKVGYSTLTIESVDISDSGVYINIEDEDESPDE
jgi:hypothetical protein